MHPRQVNISAFELRAREKVTVLPKLQRCLQSPVLHLDPKISWPSTQAFLETEQQDLTTQTQQSLTVADSQFNTKTEDKNYCKQ